MTVSAVLDLLNQDSSVGIAPEPPLSMSVPPVVKRVRPTYLEAVAEIDGVSEVEVDRSADLSMLFAQCQALCAKLTVIHEASKALDIEEHGYRERIQQIDDELTWLNNDARKEHRKQQLTAISEQIDLNEKEAEGRSPRLVAIEAEFTQMLDQEWSVAKLAELAEVHEAVERIRTIGTGSFGKTDKYYIDPISRIVGIGPGPYDFGQWGAYYMAGALRWLYERDNRIAHSNYKAEQGQLAIQKIGLQAETASLRGRLAAIEEEEAGYATRIEQLSDSRTRLEKVYGRPGFAFNDRLASLVEEFLAIAPLLYKQSRQFSSALEQRLGFAFEGFPDVRLMTGGLTVERQLAAFRGQLAHVSAMLDRIVMTSSEAVCALTVTLKRDGADLVGSAELLNRARHGRIRELLVRSSSLAAWTPVQLRLIGKGGTVVHLRTVIDGSERRADLDLALRGLDVERVDLPVTIDVSVPEADVVTTQIDLIIRTVDFDT